jgi:hypothetical protein
MTGPAGALNTAKGAGVVRGERLGSRLRTRRRGGPGHAERAALSMLTKHPGPALEATAGASR